MSFMTILRGSSSSWVENKQINPENFLQRQLQVILQHYLTKQKIGNKDKLEIKLRCTGILKQGQPTSMNRPQRHNKQLSQG